MGHPVNRKEACRSNDARGKSRYRLRSGEPCYILAVETSCDETAVSVVKNGTEVLSNLISSQIETHKAFGGVVPEVASRKHVESITYMLDEAMQTSGITPREISAVAVTQGPGLVGALLVGIVAAKSAALAFGKPLIGTHHIAGHIYANQLEHDIVYPCIALVVSGGHTELVLMESEGHFQLIGRTRDDAVGEAYDKVARAIDFRIPAVRMWIVWLMNRRKWLLCRVHGWSRILMILALAV